MNEKREYNYKPVEELTFIDDFMFGAVMKHKEICIGVLERLLHIKIDHIEYPKLQKHLKPFYTSKGVRLDVYVKDTNRVFDVELQNRKFEALGKRTRYYQSMIDMDNLMKGEDYSKLKESFVIFICTDDPFGKNRPQYSFENVCLEDSEVELDDKVHKLIYNLIKNYLRVIFETEFFQEKTRNFIVQKLSDRHPWRKKNASLGDSRNSVFA